MIKKYIKNDFKNFLCYKNSMEKLEISSKDPINHLLTTYTQLEDIIHNIGEKELLLKFFYSNTNQIKKILYDFDKIIEIKYNMLNNKNGNIFYLCLLINENEIFLNYTFSVDLIQKVSEFEVKNDIEKIMQSIMIKKLINNLRITNNLTETEKKKLDEIEEKNKKNLENDKIKKDLNITDIDNVTIDEILINIIILMIKLKKFEQEKYISNLLTSLKIDNICLTNLMYNKLENFFSEEVRFLRENYSITTIENLFEVKIIVFYFYLFMYILKNPIYIYHIDFLKQLKINIIGIINEEKISIKYELDNELNIKFKKVITFITDSEYYTNKLDIKLLNDKANKRKDENTTNSTSSSSSNKNSITNDSIINNESINENHKLIENELKEAIIMILSESQFLLVKEKNVFSYKILNEINDTQKNFLKLKDLLQRRKKLDNISILKQNFQKFLQFLKSFKEKVQSEFTKSYNLQIKLKFCVMEYEENNLFNLDCIYIFSPPNEVKVKEYKDGNILEYGINGTYMGNDFLISEINSYNDININNDFDKESKLEDDKLDDGKEKGNNINNKMSLEEEGKKENKTRFKIIEFQKIIGNHNYSAKIIKILEHGFYASGGKDKKLNIYDNKFKLTCKINLPDEPRNIFVIHNKENNNFIQFIVSTIYKTILITFDTNNYNYKFNELILSTSFCIPILNDQYLYSNGNGLFIGENLFNNQKTFSTEKISSISYRNALLITDNKIVMSSNYIIEKGTNYITLYDFVEKKTLNKSFNESIALTMNNLLLIKNEKISGIIMLCACQKYTKNKRNGILLILLDIIYNIDESNSFYETNEFEPFCFCQIFVKDEKNKKSISYTDYLLVGGFDIEKRIGQIKLFKLKYFYIDNIIKLEFIQDLTIDEANNDNFQGFIGPVTCITQSKEPENILITCSDGNVSLFSQAFVDYYLFYDKQKKERKNYLDLEFFDEDIQNAYINKRNNLFKDIFDAEKFKNILKQTSNEEFIILFS